MTPFSAGLRDTKTSRWSPQTACLFTWMHQVRSGQDQRFLLPLFSLLTFHSFLASCFSHFLFCSDRWFSSLAPYLGNQVLSYGQNFSFSLRLDHSVRQPSQNDVVLEGSGLRVAASFGALRPAVPCRQKVNYSFRWEHFRLAKSCWGGSALEKLYMFDLKQFLLFEEEVSTLQNPPLFFWFSLKRSK